MSDDIGADSTLEREIAPILSIGDAFPKILITRTRHEPHTREGVLVLNFARWLLRREQGQKSQKNVGTEDAGSAETYGIDGAAEGVRADSPKSASEGSSE